MEQNTMPPALPHLNTPEIVPAPKHLVIICVLFALFGAAMIYPSLVYGQGTEMFGVNVPLCVAGFYAAYFFTSKERVDSKRIFLPLIAIAPLAAAFALFNVPEILAINALALLVLVPLHMAWMSGGNWPSLQKGAFISQVCLDLIARPLIFIGNGFSALRVKGGKFKFALFAALGILIGMPALVFVIWSLAHADDRFLEIMAAIMDFADIAQNSDQIITTLLIAILLFFPAIGFFYSHAAGLRLSREQKEKTPGKGIPNASAYAVLMMFNAVLVLFAALQIGRMLESVSSIGYDLARASHGSFFPMLYAALICYGIQWFLRCFVAEEKTPLRVLVSIMGACLIIMMASSFRDIWWYHQVYGLSRLRIYVLFCIVTFFLILVVTLIGVWRKFPSRSIAIGLLCVSLVALNYINVDKTIAEYNFDLQERTGKVADLDYIAGLSVDVLPVCVENIDVFKDQGMWYELEIALRRAEGNEEDIRLWNFGRHLAEGLPRDYVRNY